MHYLPKSVAIAHPTNMVWACNYGPEKHWTLQTFSWSCNHLSNKEKHCMALVLFIPWKYGLLSLFDSIIFVFIRHTYIHLLIFSSDTAVLLHVLPVLDLQFLLIVFYLILFITSYVILHGFVLKIRRKSGGFKFLSLDWSSFLFFFVIVNICCSDGLSEI